MRSVSRAAGAALCVAVAIVGARTIAARETPPATAEDAPLADAASIDAARAVVASEMEAARERLAAAGKQSDIELELLERIDLAYLDLATTLGSAAFDVVEDVPDRGPGDHLSGSPPYPVGVLDVLRRLGEQYASISRQRTAELEALDGTVEALRDEIERADQARRAAREKSDRASERRHELEGRLLRAKLRLREHERSAARDALAATDAARDSIGRLGAWLVPRVRFTETDLAAARAPLEKLRFDLTRALDSGKLDLASAERRFGEAQRKVDVAEPAPEDVQEVAARRAEFHTSQRAVALIAEQLDRIDDSVEAWRRRQALLSGSATPDERLEWADEAREALASLAREAEIKATRLQELRADIHRPAEGTQHPVWAARHEQAMSRLVDLYGRDLAAIDELAALERHLLRDAEVLGLAVGFDDRLRQAMRMGRQLWGWEIAAPDDRPITVGKVVSAILAIASGYMLARLVAHLLGRRVFPRFGFDEGATHAFQSLAFYFFLVIVFLVALQVVNIPLTAFAVLGGALAIGVGFGSQNIVNNFISGIIILAERPIKVGDLIEVEGTYGTVERIGLRSTRVRSGDNIHVIVPNAAFLEQKVVNWTHNDPNVRVQLSVGIVYGSPTREAERLIRLAIEEHEGVQAVPSPLIFFSAFGDNALQFDARFWIRMRSIVQRLQIESDIRFRIDDLFREAGIVIAFPQRDVHLDTLSPLEVRVVDRSGGRSEPEAT